MIWSLTLRNWQQILWVVWLVVWSFCNFSLFLFILQKLNWEFEGLTWDIFFLVS